MPTIADRILKNFDRHSEKKAISYFDYATGQAQSITYKELKESALACALELEKRGIFGRAVAILAGKTLATYSALLGTWISGNHFVPIPRHCPPGRLASILAQAKPAHGFGLEGELSFKESSPFSNPDTAYFMFTSGSSGKPKGLAITHANLNAYLQGISSFYDFSPVDRISQVFELTFDPSISDILWAFLNGATLCPMQFLEIFALDQYLEREEISVWNGSPSLVRTALNSGLLEGKIFPSLRLSTFIGERLPTELVEKWRRIAPNSAIENLYGPAETTISVSRFHLPAGRPAPTGQDLPIGQPNPGVKFSRIEQELVVAGNQVGLGYLDPAIDGGFYGELESEDAAYERGYRTGDLCHQLSSGEWLFTGRKDFQLKISGQRFEPGEVEQVAKTAGLEHSLAIPWPPEAPESFVLAIEGALEKKMSLTLLGAFNEHLPSFARPTAIFSFPKFPLSANGKLDRNEISRFISGGKASRVFPK